MIDGRQIHGPGTVRLLARTRKSLHIRLTFDGHTSAPCECAESRQACRQPIRSRHLSCVVSKHPLPQEKSYVDLQIQSPHHVAVNGWLGLPSVQASHSQILLDASYTVRAGGERSVQILGSGRNHDGFSRRAQSRSESINRLKAHGHRGGRGIGGIGCCMGAPIGRGAYICCRFASPPTSPVPPEMSEIWRRCCWTGMGCCRGL